MEELIEEIKEKYGVDSLDEAPSWIWFLISHDCTLSEEFIRKYQDKLEWYYIAKVQVLSEDFILEFKNRVKWHWIFEYQKLSEEFIRKYHRKIKWKEVFDYPFFTDELLHKLDDIHPFKKWVRDCGDHYRTIYRKKKTPNIIHIGCFKGSKKKAIKAIQEKYGIFELKRYSYLFKVMECFRD